MPVFIRFNSLPAGLGGWRLGKKADEGPAVKVGVSAFNVVNRVNYTGYVGNQSSPFFGLPVAARPARRVQLNFNFSF